MSVPAITALALTHYPARREMLASALASFRAQSLRDAELLVVNDGVPLAAPSPEIRVLNLPDSAPLTIGDKRNAGLREARGAWVAIWDDDDISLPTRLEETFAIVSRERAKYVKSSTMWVADSSLRVAGLCAGCCYPTALFHRETALGIGGFPSLSYGEDSVFLQRLVAAGESWRDVPLRSYVHRRHASNISALICGETLQSFLARGVAACDDEMAAVQKTVDAIRASASLSSTTSSPSLLVGNLRSRR